jgi:hypothetical protein
MTAADLHREFGPVSSLPSSVSQRQPESEVIALAHERDHLAAEVLELRHRLLTSRDHAIGCEAETGRARADLGRIQVELSVTRNAVEEAAIEFDLYRQATALDKHEHNLAVAEMIRHHERIVADRIEHINQLAGEIGQLREENIRVNALAEAFGRDAAAMRSSRTWRIGSMITGPAARFRSAKLKRPRT